MIDIYWYFEIYNTVDSFLYKEIKSRTNLLWYIIRLEFDLYNQLHYQIEQEMGVFCND